MVSPSDVAVRPDSSRKRIRPTPLGWPTADDPRRERRRRGPTVGVVGGGQLARMMQQAAIGLCVPIRLLAGAADDVRGPGRQRDGARGLSGPVDAAGVRAGLRRAHLRPRARSDRHLRALLDAGVTCRPGPDALVHAQDKAVMRQRLTALGIACPAFALVGSPRELAAFAESVGGWPVVLKAPRGGYDGKGVSTVDSATQADRAFDGSADVAARRGAGRISARAVRRRRPLPDGPGGGIPRRRVRAGRRLCRRGRRPGSGPARVAGRRGAADRPAHRRRAGGDGYPRGRAVRDT